MLKIFLLIAVVCIAGCSFLYFGQESLIFHPERLSASYRYTFPGRFEELMWDVDGVKINALHFRVEHPKGAVLYFHGNAGSLRDWGEVAGEFTSRGYDIVMPDYRGYGKSTGKIKNEDMLHQDAAVAYRYLQKHYREDAIVIYGRSIGSGLAVCLAKSSKPRMLILESPFYSLRDVAQYHYPFLPSEFLDRILRYPMRSDLWIPEVACPIYLIHGTEDEVVPYSSSQKLLKLIKTNGKLIAIENGGHNNLGDFKLYQEQLDQILKQ
jgi:alpha-beta hydrolase superfamily lysophospholipase